MLGRCSLKVAVSVLGNRKAIAPAPATPTSSFDHRHLAIAFERGWPNGFRCIDAMETRVFFEILLIEIVLPQGARVDVAILDQRRGGTFH